MLGFAEAGQVSIDGGDQRTFMAEVDLDLAQVLALLKQMRGVGMTQGVDMSRLGDAAGFEGQAESPLERGAAHRFGGGAGAQAAVAFGWKEQAGVAMTFPLLAQEQQCALGQGHVTVLVAFAAADVQQHALGIDIRNLQAQAFAQAQAAGVNRAQADAMVQRGNLGQDAAHFGGREHDREFELGIGASQFQFVWPGTAEGLFPEQLESADGLGAGLTGDLFVVLEMDAVLAELFGRNQVGSFAAELAQLAHTGVIGLLGARQDRQELQVIGEGV